MTPSEIESQARNKYNAIGDTFFSSLEIMHLIYEGCMELAVDCDAIEATSTDTSVASQQAYSYPTRAISIKRVTYAGRKLKPITLREDDILTVGNSTTTETGTPRYYFIWDGSVYFRPVPAVSSDTISFFTFNEPATVTTTSTLEVPSWMHPGLVNFCLKEMCAKDGNSAMVEYYGVLWENTRKRALKYRQRKKRGDSFSTVQDEDTFNDTILGSI